MSETKRIYIKSYGCQMNVYDSERMAEAMVESGFAETAKIDEADVVVLNTCHIREKATEKIYSELGRLKSLRARNPNLKIAVAGCVAQAEGEEIVRRQPMVDIVVGPQAYHRLPSMVDKARAGKPQVDADFPRESKFLHLPSNPAKRRRPSAFLTIQEGCDKFCTFCVVPYTRGSETSRPVAQVVEEASSLVARGACEITLLGQNVNAYLGPGPDGADWPLARLIGKLAELDGLQRIRYTTSHPRDMSDDLIEIHASCGKLMPYLHLPIQSGSDRILAAMNRRHTSAEYISLIKRIRAIKPDILLSGDFIVGFPGETESDFLETMDLIQEVGYGQAYSFKYSPRPGTPAEELEQVDAEEASDRLQRLQTLIKTQQQSVQNDMIGKAVSVLLERKGRLDGQLAGKSEYMHAVHVPCDQDRLGCIVPVKITGSEPNSLSGSVLN